jgi:hypothetical protein
MQHDVHYLFDGRATLGKALRNMNTAPGLSDHLRELEAAMTKPDIRQCPNELSRLLADDFRNQTPLNRAECVYALGTLFHWQGVKVVEGADGTAKLVSILEAGK